MRDSILSIPWPQALAVAVLYVLLFDPVDRACRNVLAVFADYSNITFIFYFPLLVLALTAYVLVLSLIYFAVAPRTFSSGATLGLIIWAYVVLESWVMNTARHVLHIGGATNLDGFAPVAVTFIIGLGLLGRFLAYFQLFRNDPPSF